MGEREEAMDLEVEQKRVQAKMKRVMDRLQEFIDDPANELTHVVVLVADTMSDGAVLSHRLVKGDALLTLAISADHYRNQVLPVVQQLRVDLPSPTVRQVPMSRGVQ